MSEKKKAEVAEGPVYVFEVHAANVFSSVEDAEAHVADVVAHRPDGAAKPVIAKAV